MVMFILSIDCKAFKKIKKYIQTTLFLCYINRNETTEHNVTW